MVQSATTRADELTAALAEAVQAYEQALVILGDDQARMAAAQIPLGALLAATAQVEEAAATYLRAIGMAHLVQAQSLVSGQMSSDGDLDVQTATAFATAQTSAVLLRQALFALAQQQHNLGDYPAARTTLATILPHAGPLQQQVHRLRDAGYGAEATVQIKANRWEDAMRLAQANLAARQLCKETIQAGARQALQRQDLVQAHAWLACWSLQADGDLDRLAQELTAAEQQREAAEQAAATAKRKQEQAEAAAREGALALAAALAQPDAVVREVAFQALAERGQDNRPGVGVRNGLPDLAWCPVPGGPCRVGNQQVGPEAPFWIAQYPITNAQFQAFIAAAEGYRHSAWWVGLGRSTEPATPIWAWSNHPRESVSWDEAMAFCRWLDQERRQGRLPLPREIPASYVLRLLTEWEWEKAASWDPARKAQRPYPWGDQFSTLCANTEETGLRQTSAVGIFPSGAAPCGAHDMSGNVWEWTLSKYDASARVVRGGSWYGGAGDARAASRGGSSPGLRSGRLGFRVVVAAPIP